MDQPTIISKIIADLTPVAPDLIVDTELRGVLGEMVAMEGLVVDTVPNPLTFQSAAGTFYSTVITSPSVNIDPTGNVIGWEMCFFHQAASLSTLGTGITFLNPAAYKANSSNLIKVVAVDNSTAVAFVANINKVPIVGTSTTEIETQDGVILGRISGNSFFFAEPDNGNFLIQLGDLDDVGNGTRFSLADDGQTISFDDTAIPNIFLFNVATKQFTLSGLASTENDATPVKAVGVTANGTLVKFAVPSGGGGFSNYLGAFATLAQLVVAHTSPTVGQLALITGTGEWAMCVVAGTWSSKYKGFYPDLVAVTNDHPAPQAGDRAFLTTTMEWAVCITAGTWEATTLDAYDVATTTLDELEDEANWSNQNIYIGNGLLAPDLVAGKRAIHRTEPAVQYECLPGSTNYWIRTGNRVPATLKYSLGATAVDATADAVIPKDTDYLEAAFIPISANANAGAVLPSGGGAVIDVHAAGTTAFSATKIEVADATATGTQTITPVEWAAGTKIEVFVDAVPSTPGQGYKVAIKGFWKF